VQCWSFYAVEKDQQCGTTKGSIVAKRCSIFINMHLVQSLGVQDSWLRWSYISCWTKTSRADLIAVKQHHRVSHDAGQQQQLLAQVTKTVTLNKDCCWSTADCCYLHRCSSDLTHDAALLTLFHFLRGTYWMFRSPAGRRPTMQQLRRPSRFSRQKVHEEGPVNCDTAFMLHASSTSVRLDQTKSISSILPLVWFQSDNRGSLAV